MPDTARWRRSPFLKSAGEAIAGVGAMVAIFVYFGGLNYLGSKFDEWTATKPTLAPPGWNCRGITWRWELDKTGCEPMPGYHFEIDPVAGDGASQHVAVHNIIHTMAQRRRDFDTAQGWSLLDDKERRAILDGEASIYDFIEVNDPTSK